LIEIFYIKFLALDPLAKGVEGVGKIIPKAKPEVKKPKVVRRKSFIGLNFYEYIFFFLGYTNNIEKNIEETRRFIWTFIWKRSPIKKNKFLIL